MRLYRLCDEALFYVWDPIGVCDAPEARTEYQASLPQVYELVRLGKRDELIAYLLNVTEVRMGMRPNEELATIALEFMMRGRAWVERTPYSD
jgi:hypothetical protein